MGKETLCAARRIEGLRNLRQSYGSVTSAVGFWESLHGEDIIEEYARVAIALERATFVAEHLFQMIDPQTWRDTGGDDGQGHYEGDYRAAETAEEIAKWKVMTE